MSRFDDGRRPPYRTALPSEYGDDWRPSTLFNSFFVAVLIVVAVLAVLHERGVL